MKTVSGFLFLVLLVMVSVSGLNLIFTQAGSNVDLDEKSSGLISLYDSQYDNLTSSFNEQYEIARQKTEYDPDSNDQGDEIKDFFDHKTRVDQLRDSMNMAYKLPDLIFLSLPFVDNKDVSLYRNVVWFIIWVSLFIAIILALRNGILTEEQK